MSTSLVEDELKTGPTVPEDGGSENEEAEVADAAQNLETTAITEEEPSGLPAANEYVADAAAPPPVLAQLRPACPQAASEARFLIM